VTIAAMLAIGTLTRFSGIDATLGLPSAHAGFLSIPSSAPCWLAGGGAHRVGHRVERAVRRPAEDHREQLGLRPFLMAAANSSGGVMGKMIDAQSIVVASTATTGWPRGVDPALRVLHSIVLACLVGVL